MKYKLLFSFLGLVSIILVGNQYIQAQQTITSGTAREIKDSGKSICVEKNMREDDIPEASIKKGIEEVVISSNSIPLKLPTNQSIDIGGDIERTAIKILSKLPENISLSIPLASNSPIFRGSILEGNNESKLVIIGSVNRKGQAEAITPGQLAELFKVNLENGGSLMKDTNEKLSKRIPIFDFIVFNKRNNRMYLVPRVMAESFYVDALNSVLSCTYKAHNINLTKLRRK